MMPSKHHDGDPSGEALKQQRALQATCRIQKQNVTPKTAGDAPSQAITSGFETFKLKFRGPTKAVALLESCRQQLLRQSPAEGPAAWLQPS